MKASTISSITGAGGGGNGVATSVRLLDFSLRDIAVGSNEVSYACCGGGTPRYASVTVSAAGAVTVGMAVYGDSGGVEQGLTRVKPDEVPEYVKLFPVYGWGIGVGFALIVIGVAKCAK